MSENATIAGEIRTFEPRGELPDGIAEACMQEPLFGSGAEVLARARRPPSVLSGGDGAGIGRLVRREQIGLNVVKDCRPAARAASGALGGHSGRRGTR